MYLISTALPADEVHDASVHGHAVLHPHSDVKSADHPLPIEAHIVLQISCTPPCKPGTSLLDPKVFHDAAADVSHKGNTNTRRCQEVHDDALCRQQQQER